MVRMYTYISSNSIIFFNKKKQKKMDAIAAMGMLNTASNLVNDDSAKQQRYTEDLMDRQHNKNIDALKAQEDASMRMFKNTGYEAKVKQMKDAGLNPALIYGMGGAGGGTTGNISAPQVSAGTAPNVAAATANRNNAVGMGLQMAKLQSEIKVNESIAEANKADASLKTGAQTDYVKTQTDSLRENIKLIEQQVGTETARKEAININNDINEIEREIKTATKEQEIGKVAYLLQSAMYSALKLHEEWKSAHVDRKTKEATQPEVIENIKLLAEKTASEILVNRSGNKVNEEKAKQIIEQIKQEYQKLHVQEKGVQQRWHEIEQMVANVLKNNNAAMERQEVQSFTQILATMMQTTAKIAD